MNSYFELYNQRIFFLTEMIRDTFVTQSLAQHHIDELLHAHLKSLGYEGIFFIRGDRAYCYEVSMLPIFTGRYTSSSQVERPSSNRSVLSGGAHSPTGGRRRRRARRARSNPSQTPNSTQESPSGSERFYVSVDPNPGPYNDFRYVDNCIANQSHIKVACIFFDGRSAIERLSSEMRARWKQLESSNQNIVIFCFDPNEFEDTENLEGSQVIPIGPPQSAEVSSFLNRYRLVHDIQVDWREFEHVSSYVARALRDGQSRDHRNLKSLEVRLDNWRRAQRADGQTLTINREALSTLMNTSFPSRPAQEELGRVAGLSEEHTIEGLKELLEWTQATIDQRLRTRQTSSIASELPARLFPPSRVALQQKGSPITLALGGARGTGRRNGLTLVTRALSEAGILSSGHTVSISPEELRLSQQPEQLLRTRIEESIGGSLIIESPYSLAADSPLREIFINALNLELERIDHRRDQPLCVFLMGAEISLSELIRDTKLSEHFTEQINLEGYRYEQLCNTFERLIEDQALQLEPQLVKELPELFKQWQRDMGSVHFYHAESVAQLVQETVQHYRHRERTSDDRVILVERSDLPAVLLQHMNTPSRSATESLDQLIGLENIKALVRKKQDVMSVKLQLKRGGVSPGHYVFMGNPGTGKTTVARLMGQMFQQIGVLRRGHVIEVGRSDLVAEWAGGTAVKTREVLESALDGVLFIDEAYQLNRENDQFGREAIEELLAFMENQRTRLCVILAGYTEEMRLLLETNPGFESRVGTENKITFPDYSVSELQQIFELMARGKELSFSLDAHEDLMEVIKRMHELRPDDFGNARDVRSLIERVEEQQAENLRFEQGLTELPEVTPQDIAPSDREYIDFDLSQVDQLLIELNQLTGLHRVKELIRNKANLIHRQRELDIDSSIYPGHYLFQGSPGTGKTTVARLLGKILKGLGLLRKGHVVEVKRQDLVAGYVGQTAIKTQTVLDSALGGVLFVDEAYTLNDGGFGQEALDSILAFMENNRHRVTVIFAGYTHQINELISTNPGFDSRFGSEGRVYFDDFSPAELYEIFSRMISSDGLDDHQISEIIQLIFARMHKMKDEDFGNARVVRDFVQELKVQNANRPEGNVELVEADIPNAYLRWVKQEPSDISETLEKLNQLVGLSSVKQLIHEKIDHIKLNMLQDSSTLVEPGHYIFSGNPGTGKTTVARLFGSLLQKMGVLTRGHVVEVGRQDLVAGYAGQTATKTNDKLKEAIGGVLFIDEAYQLNQGENDQFGREATETLLAFMENNRHRLCVILAGYTHPMNELLKTNPGFESRIQQENRLMFEDFTPAELLKIFEFNHMGEGYTLTEKAQELVDRIVKRMHQFKDERFGNAREMRNLFSSLKKTQARRVLGLAPEARQQELKVLRAEDLPSLYQDMIVQDPHNVEEELGKLNQLIGLNNVKSLIQEKIDQLKLNLVMERTEAVEPGHFIFSGNPGTGKTTVARLLGAILKKMGVLRRGHVVEVGRQDLVAGYVGQTSIKTTNKLNEALDGVLFIDEAYQLIQNDQDSMGREAIETLLAFMENHRHRFTVIMAGYTHPMNELLKSNPGFESRIYPSHRLHFEDFTPDELSQIFTLMSQGQGYTLDAEAQELVHKVIGRMYQYRDERFGNARDIRNLFSAIKGTQSRRVVKLSADQRTQQAYQVVADDIPAEYRSMVVQDPTGVQGPLEELSQLIGLQDVKQVVEDITALLKVNLIEEGGHVEPGHYTFVGNPGTGKTTVARLMGRILKGLGVLRKGHVVEVSREDLVAAYVGQTAIKTSDKLHEALDGVLFVDEAYRLSSNGSGSDFGAEALNTILAFMENNRHRLTVIFAGYPNEIAQLLTLNPGFKSRITEHLRFHDYTAEQLSEIFEFCCQSEGFKVDKGLQEKVTDFFSTLHRDRHFGNARVARGLLGEMKKNRARRLFKLSTEEIQSDERTLRLSDLLKY